MAICRSCKKRIDWVRMASGKKMPIDPEQKKFVVLEVTGGRVVTGYQPHWASCPNADQHRKEGAKRG